jgi:hypothetical protein
MKFILNMSVRETAMRHFRIVAIDAPLGAACGALYGLVFGGIGAVVNGEPGRLVSIAGYFALYGAIAVSLLGVCGAILKGGEDTTASRLVAPKAPAQKRSAVEAVRHQTVPSRRRMESSLTTSNPNQPRSLTVAANHPLSC